MIRGTRGWRSGVVVGQLVLVFGGVFVLKKFPGLPGLMLVLTGLFMVAASVGTAVPWLVHDRLNKQFIPVWSWYLGVEPGAEVGGAVNALAVGSQWVITLVELAAGVVLLMASGMPKKRLELANLGLCMMGGLFGAFMLTMFIMHDKSLPAWNQYPAILGWIVVTWGVVMAEPKLRGR